jgi:hypothetical protein
MIPIVLNPFSLPAYKLLLHDLKSASKVSSVHIFLFSFEQIILQLSKFISGNKGESNSV